MIKILHNNRCSKSRQCLLFLNEENADIEIVDYIKNPLSETEIRELLRKLNLSALEIIRKNEPEWKENKPEIITEEALIVLLVKFPKLIERPIVIDGEKAMIVRPPEKIFEFLSASIKK